MNQLSSQREPRTDKTRTVFAAGDIGTAEFIRLLLLGFDIRAAAWHGDPLACGMVAFEVLVMSVDHERAQQALEEARCGSKGEWQCLACQEPVPGSFEICWNCESVHPVLGSTHLIEVEDPAKVLNVK